MEEFDNPIVKRLECWKENIAVERIDGHTRKEVKMTIGFRIPTGIKAVETQHLQEWIPQNALIVMTVG